MLKNSGIPAAHIQEAQELVFDVICHIVNHGSAHLGTPQAAQLRKANYLLQGKTVPHEIDVRARQAVLAPGG